MSKITDDILIISPDPRGLGGTPGLIFNLERISVAGGASGSPNSTISTTFITTVAGDFSNATGTLADATSDGIIKNFVMSARVVDYVLTVTNGIDSAGAAISTLTFSSTGETAMLIWDDTVGTWFILPTGVTVA